MADVVLDEWVLIRALAAEDRSSNLELESAELLVTVQQDHRWVLSHDIVQIYWRRLSASRQKGAIWTGLHRSFRGCLADAYQAEHVGSPVLVDGPYHRKDRVWVSAATGCGNGCLFVTGDLRLLAQLRACDVPERGAFVPLSVVEALERLT